MKYSSSVYDSTVTQRLSLKILLLVISVCSAVHAQELPDLGDPFRDDFSLFEEQVVGASIMGKIRSSATYVADPEVSEYINHLGYRLVANSESPSQDFQFFVLTNSTINAFALPGGYVGVHSGLILQSDNESMLAGVLSHEVAHVTQRHIARVIAAQSKARIGSLAAMAAAILASRSGGDVTQAAVMTSAALPMQTQLSFTRAHEREADRIGLRILEKAQFDPHQVPLFFKYLQRQARLYESGIPEFLRTHPITSNRVADVEARLANMPRKQVEDSVELSFIKARLRVYQGGFLGASRIFEEQMQSQNKIMKLAGMYGLIFSIIESKDLSLINLEKAREMLDFLLKAEPEHPMLLSLQADFERSFGDRNIAGTIYNDALIRYPFRKSLVYGYAELLLSFKEYVELESMMSGLLIGSDVKNPKLYEFRAKAYSGLNQKMAMHRDYAEVLALNGNLVAAINELLLAQKVTDGDFFLRTSVDSRLKELREVQQALRQ
ncbi:M48 family metalloprotease [Burkholderiales bacterium]|nr:M48 family metalloprotease [Burkholderiales bacterium]